MPASRIYINLPGFPIKSGMTPFNSGSTKALCGYPQININSIGELVAITDIAFDLHYLTPGNHEEILVESESVIKRLYGMKRKLV